MKQYSFYNVDLSVGLASGSLARVTEFSDSNSIITINRSAAQHSKVIGGRGDMVVVTSADQSGSLTFNLLQVANYNETMRDYAIKSQLNGLSEKSGVVFAPLSATLKEYDSGLEIIMTDGFIPKQPTRVRGKGINDVRWTIEFGKIQFTNDSGYDKVDK